MRVQVEARLFGRPWAEVWTRVEAEGWAEVEAGAKAREELAAKARGPQWWVWMVAGERAEAEARAEAGALAVAGVWAWARGEARARGEKVPSTLADSSTISNILSVHHRYKVGYHIWLRSPETREDYSCIIHFIAPITRLPFELLQQIFLIIVDEMTHPPLMLMRVCKEWHAVVLAIWASLSVGTTPQYFVTRTLERNQLLLDIVIDEGSHHGYFHPVNGPLKANGPFNAIFAAIEASWRWRSLVIKSFPAQADLTEDVVNSHLQRCSNATMSRFTSFKVKSTCKTSPLLNGLLRILGTTVGSELTTMEINSANVISFFAPAYPSIFHFVKDLSLDTPGIGVSNPVDLLPHLHRLERFTASHISFPIYHDDVNFPFVHTLRHLSLTAVSIQWMSGRTFHVLEHCALLFPLHRHVLHTFSATLPNCKHLTFQGYPLEILGGVLARQLTHLSVASSGPFKRWGNQQLVWLSRQVLRERRLTPQILRISIEATNKAWVDALGFMSGLEELVIHNAQPSSLGAKVFQSLVVQPVDASNLGATPTPGECSTPSCPSLRRFGLKYDRWLRPSEEFDLIPVLMSIIRSRQHSRHPLESFRLWTTRDEERPIMLIESSQTSIEGFRLLARESRIKTGSLDFIGMGLM